MNTNVEGHISDYWQRMRPVGTSVDGKGGAQWLKRGVYGYNSYFAFTGCYDAADNAAGGGHRGLEMCPGVMGDVRPTRFERLTPETYFHMGKTVAEEPGPAISPAVGTH